MNAEVKCQLSTVEPWSGLAGASEDSATRSPVVAETAVSGPGDESAEWFGSFRFDTESSVVPVSL